MKGNQFIPDKLDRTWCGSEGSIFFTSARSWQSHDCHYREATRESSMPISLRQYQSPRAARRVSGCNIKIGSLFLNWYNFIEILKMLQKWLVKEDGAPAFFTAVIRSWAMERAFEMGISVKNVCMPVSCKQKWRLPRKTGWYSYITCVSLDDFWPVWRESQSTGIGKWEQECAISVKHANTVPKTSVHWLRVVPFNNIYTDFLIQ